MDKLTVGELITELQKFDQNLEVWLPCDEEGNGYHKAYGPSYLWIEIYRNHHAYTAYSEEDLKSEHEPGIITSEDIAKLTKVVTL